jgi:CAAX prenyl protease-like protein
MREHHGLAPNVASWMHSAAFHRILPFALFLAFVAASSVLPAPESVPPDQFDSRWVYAWRAVVVGLVLAALWGKFTELRIDARMSLRDWALATVSGVAVFVLWIHLDHGWMMLGDLGLQAFDPRQYASERLHLPLTAMRLFGLVIVVPLIEELFWRSFLLRWLERQDFLALAPAAVGVRALAITSVLFALEHAQWFAGLIAGAVYGWIYVRSGKLWTPIVAHALTNALLGAWILATQDWRFW